MRRPALLFGIIAAITAIYPLVVYVGLNRFGPAVLAIGLLFILSLRVILFDQQKTLEQIVQLVLVGGLCLLAAFLQSEQLLRYYPVLMNLSFAAFFWLSLRDQQSLIERFASLVIQEITPHAKRYMRALTKIWAILLLINSFVALYTACCLSIKQWALYNGFIIYIVFGVFTLGELINRHYYKKRYEDS